MALIRALNSAISGLRTHQFRTDTIGHNLGNVDTTGFKHTRALFETIFSQTISFGTAPQGNLGGIDPMQLGLGVQVGQTSKDFSQGALEATGIASDLAIEGDGFFIANDETGTNIFSRDGSFTINPDNLLHNPANGFIVQGWQADYSTWTVTPGGPLVGISIPIGTLTVARATTTADFDGNFNTAGDVASSGQVLESDQFVDVTAGGPPYTQADVNTLMTDVGRLTSGGTIVDLSLNTGDTITMDVVKGGRSLPQKTFIVSAAPPPPGVDDSGTTFGDFLEFLEDVMGINDGLSAISDETYGGYVASGTATAVSTAASGAVNGVTFADTGWATGLLLEVDDYIRFTSGNGAGQIGQITAINTAVLNQTTLTFTELDLTRPQPVVGDDFDLNERARLSVGRGASALVNPTASIDTNREDMQSAAGRIRVSANAGDRNAFTNLQLNTNGTTFGTFNEIVQAEGESTVTSATFYDSLGTPHAVELTYVLQSQNSTAGQGNRIRWFAESESNYGPDRVVGTGYVQFDTVGAYSSQNPQAAISIDLTGTGATSPLRVDVDHSALTGFYDGVSEVAMIDQDGYAQGTLSDYSAGADGIVTGIFTNGIARTIAQIALARFANPNGLRDLGDNIFGVGVNSGQAIVGVPGQMGRGMVRGGFLEESNVDVAVQFTDLIVSQRAFQANARVITTADEMLQDLVNIV